MNDRDRRRGAGGSGLGLPMLLTIIFLILKLTNVIAWKWYWVFSPLWISIGLAIVFFLIIGFILFLAVIGIASQTNRAVAGIKGWFGKQEIEYHEEPSDEEL